MCATTCDGTGAVHVQRGGHIGDVQLRQGGHCHAGQNAKESLFCKCVIQCSGRVCAMVWIDSSPVDSQTCTAQSNNTMNIVNSMEGGERGFESLTAGS